MDEAGHASVTPHNLETLHLDAVLGGGDDESDATEGSERGSSEGVSEVAAVFGGMEGERQAVLRRLVEDWSWRGKQPVCWMAWWRCRALTPIGGRITNRVMARVQ